MRKILDHILCNVNIKHSILNYIIFELNDKRWVIILSQNIKTFEILFRHVLLNGMYFKSWSELVLPVPEPQQKQWKMKSVATNKKCPMHAEG